MIDLMQLFDIISGANDPTDVGDLHFAHASELDQGDALRLAGIRPIAEAASPTS